MYQTILSNVNKGAYFRATNRENAPLYIRGDYSRELKKISVSPYNDVNKECFHKSTFTVYVESLDDVKIKRLTVNID